MPEEGKPNDSHSRSRTPSRLRTERQVSAGGVAFRRHAPNETVEIALVCVGPQRRWQLPKGIVEEGESPEAAAIREVREEAGIQATLIAPLETVEYWYVGTPRGGERVRYHKFVHFFLLEYQSGDVRDHDAEVEEARWVASRDAVDLLAFKSEQRVMQQAQALLAGS
jgi:8-oxo-dGTP pyrophosphatase MutT (NUDIX family)